MTVFVTAEEMRQAESIAVAGGVPEPELMRRAATQIANWIDMRVRRQTRPHAVALVGPGNNGGDALVALALLHERGWRCSAVLVGRNELGSLPAREDSLQAIVCASDSVMHEADVILDGVYGTGSRADLPAAVADLFSRAAQVRSVRRTPMVAVDIPSGVDASTGAADADAFRADVTLCLGLPKKGLIIEPAASRVGELELLPIDVPEPDIPVRERLITREAVRRLLPRRDASAHKSDAGTVLIVGGAPTYFGAPRLAGEAALRVGAGLVALAVPENIVPVNAVQLPEAIYVPLPADANAAIRLLDGFVEQRTATLRARVIGPGLGRNQFATDLLTHLFPESRGKDSGGIFVPGVVDADALNWFASLKRWSERLAPGSVVLTPHPGEMARLLGVSAEYALRDPIDVVRSAAQRWRQHVVYKIGYAALATPSGDVFVAPRATPELATAGTGDVLAGAIGGLLAQGMSLSAAGQSALWIGAMAGKAARDHHGELSVLARDVISQMSYVMQDLIAPRWEA